MCVAHGRWLVEWSEHSTHTQTRRSTSHLGASETSAPCAQPPFCPAGGPEDGRIGTIRDEHGQELEFCQERRQARLCADAGQSNVVATARSRWHMGGGALVSRAVVDMCRMVGNFC